MRRALLAADLREIAVILDDESQDTGGTSQIVESLFEIPGMTETA